MYSTTEVTLKLMLRNLKLCELILQTYETYFKEEKVSFGIKSVVVKEGIVYLYKFYM